MEASADHGKTWFSPILIRFKFDYSQIWLLREYELLQCDIPSPLTHSFCCTAHSLACSTCFAHALCSFARFQALRWLHTVSAHSAMVELKRDFPLINNIFWKYSIFSATQNANERLFSLTYNSWVGRRRYVSLRIRRYVALISWYATWAFRCKCNKICTQYGRETNFHTPTYGPWTR